MKEIFPFLALPKDMQTEVVLAITKPNTFFMLTQVNRYVNSLCNKFIESKKKQFTRKSEKQIHSWAELTREFSRFSLPWYIPSLRLCCTSLYYLYDPTSMVLQIETLPNGSGNITVYDQNKTVLYIEFPNGRYAWYYPTGELLISATLKECKITGLTESYNRDGSRFDVLIIK